MQDFFTKAILLLLLLGSCQWLSAQQMPGLSNSNYSGIHSVLINPSQVADTRYGFYLNLGGAHFTANSSFTESFSSQALTYPLRLPYEDNLFESSHMSGALNPRQELYAYSEILGPSLLVKLSQNSGLALFSRYRSIINGRNIPEAFGVFYSNNPARLQESSSAPGDMQLNANSFAEFGISYGQTLLQLGNHYLKAGVSYKRLTGIYAGYAGLNGMEYNLNSDSTSMQVSAQAYELAFSSRDPLAFSLGRMFSTAGNAGSGHGFDVGFTYEFRPRVKQYEYFMDGKIRLDNTRNKYKLRAGFALLDIGSIHYQNPDLQPLQGNVAGLRLRRENFTKIGNHPAAALEDLLSQGEEDIAASSFQTQLPRRLNLQLDYHVSKSFYLNMMLEKSMHKESNGSMKIPSLLAFTPRFESDGAEFSVPVSLADDFKQLAVGTAFKVGFLELGITNIPALFSAKNRSYSGIYLGLRAFSIRYKRKDSDNDGVSDRYDFCPDVQGVWEFMGCPDTDRDGVEDKFDECPETAGPAGFNGCPDTDEDGVRDKSDLCPYEKGLVLYYGCPDSDEDGIADYEDECPALAGQTAYSGCPDSDEDGIPDSEDLCPKVSGLPEFNGCPDTDNDGIPDNEDECPQIAGLYRLNGCVDSDGDGLPDHKDDCPEEKGSELAGGCIDSDMDGVADKSDECPDTPGDAGNGGCPVFYSGYEEVQLPQDEQQALQEAEQLLEFDERNQLNAPSKEKLVSLVEILQRNPEHKLLIMYFDTLGEETAPADDGWGSPSDSWSAGEESISKARAKAVQQLLLENGLFADQVRTEQKWVEDMPEKVEWNEHSMLMLRIIK